MYSTGRAGPRGCRGPIRIGALGGLWCLVAVCDARVLGHEGLAAAAGPKIEAPLLRGAASTRRAGSPAGLAAAGAHQPAPGGGHYWPQKLGGPSSSNAVTFAASANFSAPAWIWPNVHDDCSGFFSTLIDADMNVYINAGGWDSAQGEQIRKLDADGQVLWTFGRPSVAVGAAPALYGDSLFVFLRDPLNGHCMELFSLALSTGIVEWSRRYPEYRWSGEEPSILVDNGTVFFGAARNVPVGTDTIIAVSSSNGDLMWEYEADEIMWNFKPSTPGDGSLIFASSCGAVFRLSPAGELMWRAGRHHGFYLCAPTGGALGPNGIFYTEFRERPGDNRVEDPSDTLAAYRVSDGSLLWQRHLPQPAADYPAVGRLGPDGPLAVVAVLGQNPGYPTGSEVGNVLALGSNGGGLRSSTIAVDAVTGETLWTVEYERWNSSVAAGDERVGRACVPHATATPAIAGDGTVFVGNVGGDLHAIRDANGDGNISREEVTTFRAGGAFMNAPALAPGLTVVAPCWGPVYAFKG